MLANFTGRAFAASAILLLAACSDSGTDQTAVTSTQALSATDGQALVVNDDNNTAMNIVDTAIAAESFSTLVTALQATELDTVLADETKTFTVFAPTDTAFNELGTDTINALLGDTDALSNILLYHVFADTAVNGETAISLAGNTITMANGDDAAIVLSEDGNLFINQSQVIVTDVVASNGIIHVIDAVLTPAQSTPADEPGPSMNIVETAVAAGSFTVLAEALGATGLIDTLSNPDETFTVFAPTDDAFAKLPEGTLEALLADPDALSNVLLYHVIGGAAIDSTTAISLAGENATMANGDEVAISLREGALFINDSAVTSADVLASNGIIHVIDSVLLPPSDMAEEPPQPSPEPAPTVTAPQGTILALAQGNADFSTLAAAISVAGLDGALGHPDDIYTVFAPTNAAFAALGQSTIDALIADPDALENVLRMHIIPGTVVDAETALSLVGYDIQSGNGGILKLSQNEAGELLINGVRIVATDIQAVNGIVHVLDAVILP